MRVVIEGTNWQKIFFFYYFCVILYFFQFFPTITSASDDTTLIETADITNNFVNDDNAVWQQLKYCPPGTVVTGYKFAFAENSSSHRLIQGLALRCSKLGKLFNILVPVKVIVDGVVRSNSPWDFTSKTKHVVGFVFQKWTVAGGGGGSGSKFSTGFRFPVEGERPPPPNWLKFPLNSVERGKETTFCPEHYAVCGFSVLRNEELNVITKLKLLCCYFCVPEEAQLVIYDFTNNGLTEVLHTVNKRIGVKAGQNDHTGKTKNIGSTANGGGNLELAGGQMSGRGRRNIIYPSFLLRQGDGGAGQAPSGGPPSPGGESPAPARPPGGGGGSNTSPPAGGNGGGNGGGAPMTPSSGGSTSSSYKAMFEAKLGGSAVKGWNWDETSWSLWNEDFDETDTLMCKALHRCVLKQLVGKCGKLEFNTPSFDFTSYPIRLGPLPHEQAQSSSSSSSGSPGSLLAGLLGGPKDTESPKPPDGGQTNQMDTMMMMDTESSPGEMKESWILAENLTFAKSSGMFEPPKICPPGTFVTGQQLRFNPSRGLSFTGINLKCSRRNSSGQFEPVTILKSGSGFEKMWYNGKGPAVGCTFIQFNREGLHWKQNFEIRFQGEEDMYHPVPMGAENIMRTEVRCAKNGAICGMKGMFDVERRGEMTDISFKCCHVCQPKQKMIVLESFTNLGFTDTEQNVRRTIGTARTSAVPIKPSTSAANGNDGSMMPMIMTSDLDIDPIELEAQFTAQFTNNSNNNSTNGSTIDDDSTFDWSQMPSTFWTTRQHQMMTYPCKARHRCTYKQLVGMCADVEVRTPYTVKESVPLDLGTNDKQTETNGNSIMVDRQKMGASQNLGSDMMKMARPVGSQNSINPMMPNSMNQMMRNAMNQMMPNSMNSMPNSINQMVPNSMNPMMPNSMNPMMPNSINPMMRNSINQMVPNSVNPMMPNSMNSLPNSVNQMMPNSMNSLPNSVNQMMPNSMNSLPNSVNQMMPELSNPMAQMTSDGQILNSGEIMKMIKIAVAPSSSQIMRNELMKMAVHAAVKKLQNKQEENEKNDTKSQIDPKIVQNDDWLIVENMTFGHPSKVWKEPEKICPPGSIVTAVQMKKNIGYIFGGFNLLCSMVRDDDGRRRRRQPKFEPIMELSVGKGNVSRWYDPNSVAVGFTFLQFWFRGTRWKAKWEFRFDEDVDYLRAPEGATNVTRIEVKCPKHFAICGVRTMLDKEGKGQMTTLAFKCCYFCTPLQKFVVLSAFTNRGDTSVDQMVKVVTGSRTIDEEEPDDMMVTMATNMVDPKWLQAAFVHKFSKNSTTPTPNFNWAETSRSLWTMSANDKKREGEGRMIRLDCKMGHFCSYRQLIGVCGAIEIRSPYVVRENILMNDFDEPLKLVDQPPTNLKIEITEKPTTLTSLPPPIMTTTVAVIDVAMDQLKKPKKMRNRPSYIHRRKSGETWILADGLTAGVEGSGVWTPAKLCPPGSIVTAENFLTFSDPTKRYKKNVDLLTGINLKCSMVKGNDDFVPVKILTSGQGNESTQWFDAKAAATGFVHEDYEVDGRVMKAHWAIRYKQQDKNTNYGTGSDPEAFLQIPDRAARVLKTQIACPDEHSAICGMQTMFSADRREILTGIMFKCCYFCVAQEKMVVLDSFTNLGDTESVQNIDWVIGSSLGGIDANWLKENFASRFSKNSTHSRWFNWTETSLGLFTRQKTKSTQYNCEAHHFCTFKQLLGFCGDKVEVHTPYTLKQSFLLDDDNYYRQQQETSTKSNFFKEVTMTMINMNGTTAATNFRQKSRGLGHQKNSSMVF